jgi:hypothetical protein
MSNEIVLCEKLKAHAEILSAHGGTQILFTFPNGWGASVVQHRYSYGGIEGLWELAVFDKDGKLHYDNPVADGDVQGFLKSEEVPALLLKIYNF